MIIKAELIKILHNKILVLPVLFVIGAVLDAQYVNGEFRYDSAADWDAYDAVLKAFFRAFTIFVIIFASYIFPYEKECSMAEVMGTVKYGGKALLRYKCQAAFLAVNVFLLIMLAVISVVHFGQFGFNDTGEGIQRNTSFSMVCARLNCTHGEMAVCKLMFGILGCNFILLIVLFISMVCENSLTGMFVSLVSVWLFCYDFVKLFSPPVFIRVTFLLFPVNCLNIDGMAVTLPGMAELYMIFGADIILMGLSGWLMCRKWKDGTYYLS